MKLKNLLFASLILSTGCAAHKDLIRYSNGQSYTVPVKKRAKEQSIEDRLLIDNPNYTQEIYKGILITGPQDYIDRMKMSLDLIYSKDPVNWTMVKKNITKITLIGFSGIDVEESRYLTNENKITDKFYETKEWVASEIVHDGGCHPEYDLPPFEEEKKCMEIQNEFLKRVGSDIQIDIELELKKEYWKTSHEKRYW